MRVDAVHLITKECYCCGSLNDSHSVGNAAMLVRSTECMVGCCYRDPCLCHVQLIASDAGVIDRNTRFAECALHGRVFRLELALTFTSVSTSFVIVLQCALPTKLVGDTWAQSCAGTAVPHPTPCRSFLLLPAPGTDPSDSLTPTNLRLGRQSALSYTLL